MLGSYVPGPLLGTSQSKPNKVGGSAIPAKGVAPKHDTAVPGIQSIVARTTLSLEYASLRHIDHCPLGMYVTPSPENVFGWDAVLFVHQGYYAGAVLRFRLTFPSDYPDKIPTVQFVTDIFHPLINQKGFFNLGAYFRPWKPKEHHVYNILYHIKAAFKKYRLDQIKDVDAWNQEAYRHAVRIHLAKHPMNDSMVITCNRYHESTSSFAALATQSSQLTRSESALYDKDHPSFTGQSTEGFAFQKLSPEKLREYRQKLGLREWTEESNESWH